MIILNRVTSGNKEAPTGIPMHNFICCNEDQEGKVWVSYWDGQKPYKMVVNHTIQEIQYMVFVARHGKKPAKGVLGD